ncbi:MAG: helix-turn-helix domain-containing protein, partial [Nitrospinota bacterium]
RGFSLAEKANLKVLTTFKDAKKEWLSSFEKEYLVELLRRNNNNITKASEEAGIPRMTIYRLIKKYKLDVE